MFILIILNYNNVILCGFALIYNYYNNFWLPEFIEYPHL